MMLVLTLFAMITVFAVTASVVAPVLAMLTGCFIGPIQPAFFLPPFIPSALAPGFILAFPFLPLSVIFLILSFPFYLRCRSGCRRLRG